MRELTELIAQRGKPGMIVSDNGTELTSNAVLAWCGEIGVEWHYIAPGRPMQNGYVESFNGRHRLKIARPAPFLVLPPVALVGPDSVGGLGPGPVRAGRFDLSRELRWDRIPQRRNRCLI